LQDKDIKNQVENKIIQTLGKNHPYHIETTVFYGKVLLTGEMTNPKDKTKLNQAIKPIYGIRGVYNEVIIGGNSSLTSRSSDVVITGQIKTTFLNTANLPTNAIKVVTERGVVYLMGVVTNKEGNQAAELASQTSGVVKVVKLLERISESDLQEQEQK
jgi:osmotically-inducible protein OsmY